MKRCYICDASTTNLVKKVPVCPDCVKEYFLSEDGEGDYQVDTSAMKPSDWEIADTEPYGFFGEPPVKPGGPRGI